MIASKRDRSPGRTVQQAGIAERLIQLDDEAVETRSSLALRREAAGVAEPKAELDRPVAVAWDSKLE